MTYSVAIIDYPTGCINWYKLVDKNGKADKERGEVLLDIQFMRNNMTASMFDLSMQDKPRSRISKLKDKVRGKKKDGLSDSASAIVPSTVGQVLTDSEGEDEANPDSAKGKKSSKLKSLFAPKSNLHRGVSQSMSTLGTLPEKNSSLSSSRSSGLNGESPDVKKKFKFLGHKRTSSTDSKVSLGPFSLLNRSKQNIPEQNNLCINGSHVYAEEQEPKPSFGSTLSLSSSAKGSVEDLRKYHERNASDVSADSFKGLSIPTYKPEPVEKALHVPQHPQEDEEKKHKKTEGRLQEVLERQEEQERMRQQEREERRRKQEEEERKIRLEEEQRKRQEEEERQRKRREEEAKRAEEQRRQEESRVAERLTSLFGLGKKKEEPSPPAVVDPKPMDVPASTNPFEEIPLSPDSTNPFLVESPAKAQKEERNTFTPTPPTNAFPGRTAKVSAVKPRLALSPKPETDNTDPLVSPDTSDIQPTVPGSSLSPKPSPSSDPFESFAMFSEIHSTLAPPKPQRTFAESPRGSMENLSGADYTTSMSEKKHRALQPPNYPGGSSKNGTHHPKNEVSSLNSQSQRPPLPLPDYDALFPKKRHGVMTNTRWEHIIAEVNQRKTDSHLKNIEEEMSVDGPNEPVPNKSEIIKERNSSSFNKHHKDYLEASSVSMTRMEPKQALIPPKSTTSATARQVLEVNSKQVLTPEPVYATVEKSNRFASRALRSDSTPKVQQEPQVKEKRTFSTAVSAVAQPSETKERPTPAARAVKTSNSLENSNAEDDTTELPSAKPRLKVAEKEPVIQVQPEQPTTLSLTLSEKAQVERKKGSMTHKSSWENKGLEERMQVPVNVSNITHIAKNEDVPKEQPVADVFKGPEKELIDSDPFPNDKLICLDPWALPEQDTHQDDLFTSGLKKNHKV
ncbi:mitogen-activated protein kinase kinase kinase kinase 4 isoform X2 [Colossoma macropomum]|uniref:mitogen-activated protein kinase kinase kinase kinase 4 isoform X2 n=1 Tax=Colossoma macropomum TaxID=42526 RepID=UPI0018655FA6|nr:mitogen-activated protein kinase kinase kinase kinase 4 isoform X2 [Colossoma macropomum]